MAAQKLLLPVGGQPVIARVADQVLAGPVDRVFVVIRPEEGPIIGALAGRGVTFVTNPDTAGEMLSSVRCGLAAMPEQCVAVLVVLGDQPDVTARVVGRMVEAFRESGRGIVVPTYRGRRGHPLLVAMKYREEILTGFDDVGLRGLLQAHPDEVREVDVGTPGILEDLDLPEDYRRAAARFPNPPDP